MYVFVSERDAVLRHLLPMVGTADRQPGSVRAAGLRGFQRLANPSAETQAQYAKLAHIHWEPKFGKKVMDVPTRARPLATEGKGRNPDYERWARASPGAWIRFQGHQLVGGRRQPLYVKVTLVERQADKLIVEWAYFADGSDDTTPERIQEFIEWAWIDPQAHPRTHPDAKVTKAPGELVTAGGKVLTCDVQTVDVAAEFPDWGRDLSVKLVTHDDLPGTVSRMVVNSHKGEQPFEFVADVVDFRNVVE